MGLDLKQKADHALKLRDEYLNAYGRGDIESGKNIEREYLRLRLEIISDVDMEISRQKSVPIKFIKEEMRNTPKKPKRETGVRVLDRELVTEKEYARHDIGGFALGSYIQIAGSRGSGKTSLMLKILSTLSQYERVGWFDFEMGKRRSTEEIEEFKHNENNVLYYNASRELSDVVAEIKLLHASGVNHFLIDSTMKMNMTGTQDRYEKYSKISQVLSELTSTLGINIYIINQISQSSERDGVLSIKHGNDVEYDADYIIYILKLKLIENGRAKKDEYGMDMFDEGSRLLKCTKNREDKRTFSVKIMKSDIFTPGPIEIEYEE